MTAGQPATESDPVRESARITSLDLIRGGAVLGILLMNAVSFKFGLPPYLNLSAGGSETWLDWAVGILGEIFIDQKFMGLFSLLFGAGMILFIDRASARGRRAVLLNLWRNGLLLIVGILHFLLWVGDVLMLYAISSVSLIALRKLPDKALIGVGVVVFTLSVACAFLAQNIADTTGTSLAGIWTPGEIETLDWIGIPGIVRLLPARSRDDSDRGRPIPHRLHKRRHAGEDIPQYGNRRSLRGTAASRTRRHLNRVERLLTRGCIHWPDSQYPWHDPRIAWLHEPHHPLE